MEISQNGINLIKNFEGCRLKAYRCPAGVLTIGYGHTGKDVSTGMVISQEKAENMLKHDLIIHTNNVSKLVKVPITQNQFDALVSLEYNIGYNAFRTSTLLKLLNEKKYAYVPAQFDRWVYASGIKLHGLVVRRQKERELYERK